MHGLILRIRCLPRIRRPAITGKSRLWQGQVMSSNKAGLGPALNRCRGAGGGDCAGTGRASPRRAVVSL